MDTMQNFARSLAAMFREELGFYRSLYVLLDRQRDWLKYERDSRILDIYTDIEKLKKRIQESQDKITGVRERNETQFRVALEAPEVARLVDNITSLINKCVEVVAENESIAETKSERLRSELAGLADGRQFYAALEPETAPRFVDQKK